MMTQDIWLKLQPEEQNLLKQINLKIGKIENLKSEQSEIYADIKTAQKLLTLFFRDRYDREGYVKDADVIFKEKKSKHKVEFTFFDSETNRMAVMLNPMLKRGSHKLTYVDEVELVKPKKRKFKLTKK